MAQLTYETIARVDHIYIVEGDRLTAAYIEEGEIQYLPIEYTLQELLDMQQPEDREVYFWEDRGDNNPLSAYWVDEDGVGRWLPCGS